MKKILLTFAFIAVAQLGMAQQQDEAFKKDVMTLIQSTGATASMKAMTDQVVQMIPKEKQAAFQKDFDAMMPSLYDKIAKIYMETYTKEDVKAMLNFYQSAVGKKIAEKAGVLSEKTMAAAQEWAGENLQDMVMKYMQ